MSNLLRRLEQSEEKLTEIEDEVVNLIDQCPNRKEEKHLYAAILAAQEAIDTLKAEEIARISE